MQLVPQFNESAQHQTETPEPEPTHELFDHPSAVTLVEKIDYLYEQAQKIATLLDQITPAQVQQANTIANGPLGNMLAKMLIR